MFLVKEGTLCYFNPAAARAFWSIRLQENGPAPEELAQAVEGTLTIRGGGWLCHCRTLPEGTLYQLRQPSEDAECRVLLNRLPGRNTSNLMLLNEALRSLENGLVETERLRCEKELAGLWQVYARMLSTNHDIDCFCRMAEEEVDLNYPMRTQDLAGLCRAVYRQCEYLLEKAGITLVYQEEAGSILVRGNETLLFQALYHLLSNAAKSYGRKPGTVTLRVAVEGSSGMIVVEDEGRGISQEALRTAFDISENPSYLLPFALELPLSRRIANYHGGGLFLLRREKGMQAVFSIPTVEGRFRRAQEPKIAEKLASLRQEDGSLHPALVTLSSVVPSEVFSCMEDY